MISDIRYWEKKASEGHYAIPHFNVWNAEMLMGVIDAAEELRAPIIISFGTGFTGNTSFEDYCYMMESMAKKATVPVILHWDHGRNMTILQNAVNHCMNSVMRDASALPYEENVAEIKRCVDYFHAYNIPVEAELGHVGNETIYEEALAEYHYTDPKQAKDFVDRTGCDSLAIAIGNVHGVYSSEPKLAFDILEEVAKTVDVPIVLHGASGIGDEDIKKAKGVLVVDRQEDGGYASLTDAQGEGSIFVGRVRQDMTVDNGISLWIAGDAARIAAQNILALVKQFLKKDKQ